MSFSLLAYLPDFSRPNGAAWRNLSQSLSKGDIMKKGLSLLIAFALCLTVFNMGILAQSHPKMKMRFGNVVSKRLPPVKIDTFVAEQLQKRTNGAIRVKLYHGATLGNHKEMIDLIGEGAVEMGNFAAAYNFSRIPMEMFYSLPFVYPDIQTLVELGPAGWKQSKKMQEDHIKNNLFAFNHRGLGVTHLISKKPIRTLADLKGLKVRAFGAIFPKLVSELGAIPVNLQAHEVYEGLQRGTVDAAISTYAAAFAYKFYEVAPNLIDINLGTDSVFRSYINLDIYNSWPQQTRDLFNQIVKESEAMGIKVMIGFEKYALATMKKKGAKVIHFEDQHKLASFRDSALDLAVEILTAQGEEYSQPAREYADWLKVELNKRK